MIPISIIQVIDGRRHELKMKKADLARAGGMRPANVRTLFSKKNPNPDLVTLFRLMNPLGLRWECSDATDGRGLIARFAAEMEALGWSESQLAEIAGVDVSNLRRLFASENPRSRLRLLLEIADALKLSMKLVPRSDARNNAGECQGSCRVKISLSF